MYRTYINNFVENEFSLLQLNDKRLSDRAIRVATILLNNPESSIPVAANGSRKEVKGIYRFFQNKNVDDQNLLETHYSNTANRIKKSKGNVLLIADSTYITPCKSRTMKNLKNIGEPEGKKKFAIKGIRVHFIMAYDLVLKEVLGITDLVMIKKKI